MPVKTREAFVRDQHQVEVAMRSRFTKLRTIAVALPAAAGLALAGCAGAGGGGDSGGGGGGGDKSINVLMVGNPQMVDIQKLTADSFTKDTGIKVTFAPEFGKWTEDGGIRVMEDMLTKHKDINAVFCEGDVMCLGAQKAIADAKIKTDKIDATVLAHLLRADLVPEAWAPSDKARDCVSPCVSGCFTCGCAR